MNNNTRFDRNIRRLRKRLWWCCYMRDQLITLSMRKPNRIRTPHEVTMVALDDFDTAAMDESVLRFLGDLESWSDVRTRLTMANLCIEKIKLCICIQNVLSTRYTEAIVELTMSASHSVLMLTPRQNGGDIMEAINCEQRLDEWNEHLPQDCYLGSRTVSEQIEAEKDVLLVHRGVLSMLYLSALSTLHRPLIGSESPSLRAKPFILKYLSLQKQRVEEAAVEITQIATQLQRHNLTRFLPPVGVTILIPAMMTHLLELKARPTLENPSIRYFQQCVEVLRTLQNHIPSGDYAYDFIDAAVRRCNLELGIGVARRHVQDIVGVMSIPPPSPLRSDIEDRGKQEGDGSTRSGPTQISPLGTTANSAGDYGIINEAEFFLDLDAFTDFYNGDTGVAWGFE